MGAASSVSLTTSLTRYVTCYRNKLITNNDNDYNSIININQNNDDKLYILDRTSSSSSSSVESSSPSSSSSSSKVEHFEGISILLIYLLL